MKRKIFFSSTEFLFLGLGLCWGLSLSSQLSMAQSQSQSKSQTASSLPSTPSTPVLPSITLNKNHCLYEDKSTDIKEFSSEALRRLTAMADGKKSECQPVLAQSQDIEANIKRYIDSVYLQQGVLQPGTMVSGNLPTSGAVVIPGYIIPSGTPVSTAMSNQVLQANCQNFEQVLAFQLDRYRQQAYMGGFIDDNNVFKGKCLDKDNKDSNDNSSESANFDQCLKDVLAVELQKIQNYCLNSQQSSLKDLASQWRIRIQTQEAALYQVEKGLKSLFDNALSGNCFAGADMAKAVLQTTITLGAQVAGAALGPAGSVMTNMGGQALNFLIEALSKMSGRGLMVREILKEKDFEQMACMFQGLHQRYCEKWNQNVPQAVTKMVCTLRDHRKHYPVLDLVDSFNQSASLAPSLSATTPTIGDYQDVKNLLELFQQKRTLPYSKSEWDDAYGRKENLPPAQEKNLEEILDLAIEFYSQKNKEDRNFLLQLKDHLNEAKIVSEIYGNLKKQTGPWTMESWDKKAQTEEMALQKMAVIMANFGQKQEQQGPLDQTTRLGKLIENYLTHRALGSVGLEKVLAEEMSFEIFKDLQKKVQTYEGDMDALRDLMDSSVEEMRGIFSDRLEKRFYTSFQNAYHAEKNNVSSKNHRREVFAWLRDIVKDCLSTQALFFMKRDRPGLIRGLFGKPQVSALLNIDPTPEAYLKACQPFICDKTGIPVPHFPDKARYSQAFHRYTCGPLSNPEGIFAKLRETYIEEGEICGMTLGEIVGEIKPSFKAKDQDIRVLKRLILNQH